MLSVTIGFVIISVAISVFCYLSTSSIIFAAILLVLFLAYYFIFGRRYLKKYFSIIRRVNSCYFFINSFIVTISVKESIEEGYKSGLRVEDSQLHTYANELEELTSYEKVKYLRSYFNLSIYKMFLNILEVYQDQGGNILTMSDNLIRETTRVEKTITESKGISVKHAVEFIVMWALSFAVLLFMKFGIQDFYNRMLNLPLFAPLIFGYFLLCLASIHLFIRSFSNLSIKEDNLSWSH